MGGHLIRIVPKQPSTKPCRYTLPQITTLAQKFVHGKQVTQGASNDSTTALVLSQFLIWLAKREKEGEGNGRETKQT